MPCNYLIDVERRLVITSAWDVVTSAEALEHQNKLAADKAFQPEFCQLLDCTRITKLAINLPMIRRLATRSFFSRQSRRAFVVKGKMAYGVARMFQSYREVFGGPEQIRIFEDRDEALEWLLNR
jgi:hypothetical protein